MLAGLLEQFHELDNDITQYDCKIRELAKLSEPARRLLQVESIGPMTATAIVASMGDPHVFKRTQLRRLARVGTATALEWWQESAGSNHQTG